MGGAELMLRRLVLFHRANRDIKHRIISLTSLGVIGGQLRDAGIEVDCIGMKSFLGAPRALLSLMWRVRAYKPDLVQTWMYHADLLGGLAARLMGVKNIVWGIRTTDVSAGCSRGTAWVRATCSWLSRFIPVRIICAANASMIAHQRIGYCAEKMIVVPNGFEVERFRLDKDVREQSRSKFGFGSEEIVLGCVGRFNPDKDFLNFIRAASDVMRVNPMVRALLIGRDVCPENVELNGWLEESGFSERFVLLGQRADIPFCLASLDIFVLSSRTEGFPNVLGEAMAMGLPAVTTDVGDAAYLLGDCGVVVPKEDSTALSAGIRSLLSKGADERKLIGDAARERIVRNFSMPSCCERFESVYSMVLKKHN